MALNDSETRGMPGNGERDPGLDRLYRAAEHAAPPASLDAAILAAARREVGARPHSLSSGLHRWRVPVSIAAVFVLSFSLVTLVKEEGGEPFRQALLTEAPLPRQPAAQPADSVQPAAVVPGARQMREPGAEAVPARPVRREDAAAGAPTAMAGVAEGNISGGGPSPSASRDAAADVAPGTAARPQPFRESTSELELSVSAAPPAKSTEDLAARTPAVAERRAAPMAAPAEPAGARRLTQAKKEAAATEDRPPVWHGLENEPPQKWIERVAELRRQQRGVEAEALLAEFRRRFPDHPLPPGLQ
jgi:hypothetical protein